MEIIRIEPTPSPNTMKITVSEEKEDMKSATYRKASDEAPEFINRVLELEDVTSVFHAMNFISVDKSPKADWETLIPEIENTFNADNNDSDVKKKPINSSPFGEVNVQVLTFKGIPYQIKLNDGEEHREQLDDRFVKAVAEATMPEDNIIMGRKWEQNSTRYGTPDEVFTEVIEEINALYDEETLARLVEEAKSKQPPSPKEYRKLSVQEFKDAEDWKERLNLLDHMENPTKDDYELLELALQDEKMQVRRTAVYLLAMIEDKETLSYLKAGLEDRAVPVRRTAGDGYSDLGLKEGLKDMYPLLDDRSPIVRWRAAMFIYEVGDKESLPYLYEYQDDSQYDVKLQKEIAIARIEKGEEAMGSVWKQIQERER